MKTKFALLPFLLFSIYAQSAVADSLSGVYENAVCEDHYYQNGIDVWAKQPYRESFVVQYEASDEALTSQVIGVWLNGKEHLRTDENVSNLAVGVKIFRPTEDLINLGYTLVSHNISGYSADKSEFLVKEYLYDVSFSDAEGIALGKLGPETNFSGLHSTFSVKATANGLITTKTYSNGETYICKLSRR